MLDPAYLVPRGVHRAPYLSPNGEIMLYAVDHNHRLLRPIEMAFLVVRAGDNPLVASDELWEQLERADPEPPETRLAAS